MYKRQKNYHYFERQAWPNGKQHVTIQDEAYAGFPYLHYYQWTDTVHYAFEDHVIDPVVSSVHIPIDFRRRFLPSSEQVMHIKMEGQTLPLIHLLVEYFCSVWLFDPPTYTFDGRFRPLDWLDYDTTIVYGIWETMTGEADSIGTFFRINGEKAQFAMVFAIGGDLHFHYLTENHAHITLWEPYTIPEGHWGVLRAEIFYKKSDKGHKDGESLTIFHCGGLKTDDD